jgi:hypothetical protein
LLDIDFSDIFGIFTVYGGDSIYAASLSDVFDDSAGHLAFDAFIRYIVQRPVERREVRARIVRLLYLAGYPV